MRRTPQVLKLVFAFNVVFLLLFLGSIPHVESGSGAHVASILALIPIVLIFVLLAILTYVEIDIFDF